MHVRCFMLLAYLVENQDCLMSLMMSLIQIKLTLEQVVLAWKKGRKESTWCSEKQAINTNIGTWQAHSGLL